MPLSPWQPISKERDRQIKRLCSTHLLLNNGECQREIRLITAQTYAFEIFKFWKHAFDPRIEVVDCHEHWRSIFVRAEKENRDREREREGGRTAKWVLMISGSNLCQFVV